MKRRMVRHLPYSDDAAARGQVNTPVESAGGTFARGGLATASARAGADTAAANAMVPPYDTAYSNHQSFRALHSEKELAPWIAPSIAHRLPWLGAVVELVLGFQLGRAMFGADGAFLGLGEKVLLNVAAVVVGGLFGLAGLGLAIGIGRLGGRFLAVRGGTSLQDEPGTHDYGAPLRVIAALAVFVLLGYYGANTIREGSLSSASSSVNPWLVALLGVIVAMALALVEVFWFAREAVVADDQLATEVCRTRQAWSGPYVAAERSNRMLMAKRASLISSSRLIHAVQLPIDRSSAPELAATLLLIEEAYPIPALRVPLALREQGTPGRADLGVVRTLPTSPNDESENATG